MTYSSQPSPYSSTASAQSAEWKPLITYTLMGVTIFIYLIQILTKSLFGVDYPAMLGMKVNELIIQGQYWRLFTPMFLHASILHIGFNMYALFVLGTGLERFYGHKRFLALYLLSGFSGVVASFLFSPGPSLGASTAIFGLLGAQGVFFYQNREIIGSAARSSLANVVTIAAINLVIGLSPGIDNWGHMGGLVGGIIFAWFAGPKYERRDMLSMPPVVDSRVPGDAVRAGVLVFAIFSALAGYKIFISA
jgi:rhomboid protease GluP